MYIDMCVGVKHIVPRGVAMPTTAPLPTLGRSLWWIRQDLSVHQLPSDLAQPDATRGRTVPRWEIPEIKQSWENLGNPSMDWFKGNFTGKPHI